MLIFARFSFSKIVVLALGLLFFFGPIFVQASDMERTYRYDTFICKYFNAVLIPLGGCKSKLPQEVLRGGV